MNRRTLTTIALLGLAVAALPQVGFAQSGSLIGTWRLNLDKSKFSPGPPPRSATLTYTLKSDEFSFVFLRRLRFGDGRRPIAL
jgi:hypothetical protein